MHARAARLPGSLLPLRLGRSGGSCVRGLIQTPDDTSDRISFRVKGGLVIELCFRVCLNDGLGSFVGRAIFIFSPSPLGSA